MRVTVNDGTQINHEGKLRGAGESFDAPDAVAQRWVDAGYAKAVSGSKNKAVSADDARNKAASKADEPAQAEEEDLSSLTVEELRQRASDQDIEGRSGMNKDELVKALGG